MDIAVKDYKIVKKGTISEGDASTKVDCTGLHIAPGFVDTHTHDDAIFFKHKKFQIPKISQGVTTVIGGNCGISLCPLTSAENDSCEIPEPLNILGDPSDFRFETLLEYKKALRDQGHSVNYAQLIGHNTLRVKWLNNYKQKATKNEIRSMNAYVESSMKEGAIGLSSGTYYKPGHSTTNEELLEILKPVAEAGGIYTTHMRDEYDGVEKSLLDSFETAKKASVSLVISHHKCAGKKNWGRSVDTLALIDKFRTQQNIWLDAYPYTAGSTILDPEYISDDIETLITYSKSYPEFTAKYLRGISKSLGISQKEAAKKLSPGGACYFQMHQSDVDRITSHPATMIGSDGLPMDIHPHPRLYGTFPRFLGHMSRDRGLINLEEAIRKITSLPAIVFGLEKRGLIKEGYFADLVCFNKQEIIDTATFESPLKLAKGIQLVYVNGKQTFKEGTFNEESLAGKFLSLN